MSWMNFCNKKKSCGSNEGRLSGLAKGIGILRSFMPGRVLGDDGAWCNSKERIQQTISTYFWELFKFSNPFEEALARVLGGMSMRVSVEMNEALTQLFSSEEGELRGVAISRQGPRVSQLLFADDTLIFCQATEEAGPDIEGLSGGFWLDGYGSAYRASVARIYLRRGLMADFLRHNKDVQRVHWLSWSKLCISKNEGGLGFRKLDAFNRAPLAKQLWRTIHNPTSLLSCLLKYKYYLSSDVLSAGAGSDNSYTWRSILSAPDLVVARSRWQVGSGCSIHTWTDRWLPRPMTFQVISAPNMLPSDAVVGDLLDEEGEWNETLVQIVFCSEDAVVILGITSNALS
ncbi:UNVERIFIED_CONTAM: putative mitochondrial protein [Sesamum radiatum]|uniref:Mitochondrial protein n=1 Tax=Sesamum radiatum TaxID=300843 RepID=A0AAW2TYB5_SESRA